MKGLFSYDSPVVQSLMTIGDCICLSVLWIVFSLPLVTVGASTAALYAAAYHHIRMKEGHGLWRTFWDAFKENFKRSTLVWLAVLAVMTLLTVDVFVLRSIRLSGGTMGVLYAPALVLWCAALTPDMEYDKNGCFSGSAIELPDGRQLLMYTGVRQVREENGDLRDRQTQCLAIGDGVDYEKLDANPVISARDLPEGGSYVDFRDPKIWREGDTYYVVVGDRPADGSGSILLYESKDCRTWTYDGVLAACHNQYGQMWECPDFFHLDGKHVLLTSPQEMTVIGLEFHAGNGTVCLIGEYDRANHHLIRENVQAIDYGLDFYAPQTLENPDGRRVMIAWMQNWETAGCQPQGARVFGQMTIPRELAVKDGRLFQNPVRELEACRSYQILYRNVLLNGLTTLRNVKGRTIDMTVTVRPAVQNGLYHWFKINVAGDGEHMTTARYKPECNTVRIDRTRCGFPHDIVNVRDFLVRPRQGEIKLRLVLDRYSMELFVNDGEQAATSVIYTDVSANAISFEADGSVIMDVEKYDLIVD